MYIIIQETDGCVAANWNMKGYVCLLLSGYKALQDKKGWTAGFCETIVTTEPPSQCYLEENQAYTFAKPDLISRSKTDSADLCLNECQVLYRLRK